jgi:hypothetical protein
MENIELEIFFVGNDLETAKRSLPFESFESAFLYAVGEKPTNVYSVKAQIDLDSMELEEEVS